MAGCILRGKSSVLSRRDKALRLVPSLMIIVTRSVAANIDYSLVSDLSNFFLQLRIGPTDLLMVVPRNDAIFPKLHTNQY